MIILAAVHLFGSDAIGTHCPQPYRILLGLLAVLIFSSTPSLARADSYQIDITYTGDLWSNVSGGLEKGSRYLDNLNMTLEVDVAEVWGNGNGTLFIYGLYNNSSTFSDELVGDLQVISNIDAPRAWRIFEFWYEFGKGPWSLRSGLYDLNSEFDVNEVSGLFLNSSHGIGPDISQSGLNGPSIFPISSLGVRFSTKIGKTTARMVLLDGIPGNPENPASNTIDLGGGDGLLTVVELEAPFAESGRIWGGYWRYSKAIEQEFNPGYLGANSGWYVGAKRGFQIGQLSIDWFVRYGHANEDLNPIKDYLGMGMVIKGPFAKRQQDQFGIAIASAHIGNPYKRYLIQSGANAQSRETNFELTYRILINGRFVLQPNIQFVHNPSASGLLQNAWVIGLRFEINFLSAGK